LKEKEIRKNWNIISIWNKYFLNKAPIFEVAISIGLIIIRVGMNEMNEITNNNINYNYGFYDTGAIIAYLICLEHLYISYYLIIILAIVYWSLYVCIKDFGGWTWRNKIKISIIMEIIKRKNFVIWEIMKYIKKKIEIRIMKIIKIKREIKIIGEMYKENKKENVEKNIIWEKWKKKRMKVKKKREKS